jgi:hypothetical protein
VSVIAGEAKVCIDACIDMAVAPVDSRAEGYPVIFRAQSQIGIGKR